MDESTATAESPAGQVRGHDGCSTPSQPQRSFLDEGDSTPRSEAPSAPDALTATLLTQLQPLPPEPNYFSPQPLRLYSSPIAHSTPSSAAPSPSPAEPTASPFTPAERPAFPHSISSNSTASTSTVRANTLDLNHTFGAHSRREGPVYPNQSYAALHLQQHPTTHVAPIVRSRSTHPHPIHSAGNSLSGLATFGISDDHYKDIMESGPRTVGNSPVSSPGLFDPTTRRSQNLDQLHDGLYSTPWLHHTHRQPPKETHIADVQADPVSGRKIINQYEIIDELGRGVHGKVKLGKDLITGRYVAIKIVDRYSKRRRLGKNTSHEDKIKREIAILKKARHPNIVSLLEVIDDPAKKKVYIVLEHVELGEVKWRAEGAHEICLVEWRRFKRESEGVFDNDSAVLEDEKIIRLAHQKLARQQRQLAREARRRNGVAANDPWSLEFGIDSEDDYSEAGQSSQASNHDGEHPPSRIASFERQDHSSQHETNMETAFRSSTPSNHSRSSDSIAATGLEGTMYGAYDTEFVRPGAPSIADSSSSHLTDAENEIPEHFQWVPLMTTQAAWEAFKDTVLGIEYLHYQKVIHRDIKPANLLVTKEHRIKISDFGVSYLGRGKTEESNGDQVESDYQEVDEAIELAKTVGTPAFYAPELCRTEVDVDTPIIDGGIDVWALGVTLYCLIYGRVPFHDTNTFTLMKVISEEEPYIPRYRLKPVAESSTSRPNSRGRNTQTMLSSRRAPHDLEYEEVDESLRDLLRRLLVKDARKRITIPDIKRHPWVLSGISNSDAWVKETDPSRSYDGRRIEISKDDVEKAVVPIGIVERIRSAAKKTGDFFKGIQRTSGSRRRAQSSVTNQEPPPSISTNSSSSTISQDGRRPSIAPGAILELLGRSREPEHPLSHSVTASPEARERCKYFESPNSRTGSPAQGVEGHRPPLPDRAISSVQTIRQADMFQGRSSSPIFSPALPGTPTALDSPGGSQLGGLFGGLPRRVVASMRSKDKLRPPKGDHSRAKSIDRLIGGDDDPHGVPSLALSTTTACGQVDQPDALKDFSPVPRGASPSHSEPYSLGQLDTGSRQSSLSSLSSRLHHKWATVNELDVGPSLGITSDPKPEYTRPQTMFLQNAQEFNPGRRPSLPGHLLARQKSDHRVNRSEDRSMQLRIREPTSYGERPTSATYPRPPSSLSHTACPPSPDDELFFQRKMKEYLECNDPSSENSPIGEQERGLAFSSSEEQFTPMSQSTSNPSIPSVASAGSSLPDECAPLNNFASMVPTMSADSITVQQSEVPVVDLSRPREDNAIDSAGDDESDEEDVGIVMKSRTKQPAKRSNSISVAEAMRSHPVSESRRHHRSTRSGSNGTVKKVSPIESERTPTPDRPTTASH